MVAGMEEASHPSHPSHPLTIKVTEAQHVSGLLLVPDGARACLVLAHGAGAGMSHPFMTGIASGLQERGVATLRYQFPYMERGSRRPDPPSVAHTVVRAAVEEAGRRLPGLPLFAGGKSFGGRMTSQAQAAEPLPGVIGLVFLGFPLHAPGKPGRARAPRPAQAGGFKARRAGAAAGIRRRRPLLPRAREEREEERGRDE